MQTARRAALGCIALMSSSTTNSLNRDERAQSRLCQQLSELKLVPDCIHISLSIHKGKCMKYPFVLSIVLISQAASATTGACVMRPFPDSQLLNVSSAGWASKDEPLVACTIVNPEISNDSGIAFFSETLTGDAYLALRYVDKPFPIRVADNWTTEVPESQRANLAGALRNPLKETDAAIVLHVDKSLYQGLPDGAKNLATYRYGVCAYGYPKEGRAWTTLSISTLTQSACPWQNVPPVSYFER